MVCVGRLDRKRSLGYRAEIRLGFDAGQNRINKIFAFSISINYSWKTGGPLENGGSVPVELHYAGSPSQVTNTF